MEENEAKVGMKVRIADNPQALDDTPGWVSGMDRYKGKIATITQVRNYGEIGLDVDEDDWCWHTRWLTPVEGARKVVTHFSMHPQSLTFDFHTPLCNQTSNNPDVCADWEAVTCKNCLRMRKED